MAPDGLIYTSFFSHLSSVIDQNKVLPFAELSRQELQKLASFKAPAKPRRNTLINFVVEDVWKRLSEENSKLHSNSGNDENKRIQNTIDEVVHESKLE